MVALSESVMKNCLKRPLAETLRWRHIRLAIRPRYLGNHASQIKSYYGSLSGSHGRSFRIRQEKMPEAPPGGGLTMTWYPLGNKTSLSLKLCIPDRKLLWNAIRKSWSLFQNPSWIIAWSTPWAEDWRWRHVRLAIKHLYLGNPASHLSHYGLLSWSLGCLVIFIKRKQHISIQKMASRRPIYTFQLTRQYYWVTLKNVFAVSCERLTPLTTFIFWKGFWINL